MKTKRSLIFQWLAGAAVLPLVIASAPAQVPVLINAFDTADEVADTAHGGANAWGNWYGTAFYQVLWDASDASNNPSSGSLKIEAYYPDSGIGGNYGPQFLAQNGYGGINPPLIGNGGPPTAALATNLEFDIRFDPDSLYVTNAANWPTIEVGTRGLDYTADTFGTVTLPHSQTNWVHVVLPIAANPAWTNIPNVFFKYWTASISNSWLRLYVDNVKFITAAVPIVPPTMGIEKSRRALRIFAGSTVNTYDREQLTAVDTNQSWVGASYPVSYSFQLLNFPVAPTNQTALFRYHIFLIPLNYAGGNNWRNNEYLEYQAENNLWLNISALDTLTPGSVQAELAWKTNLPNSNPNQIALSFTNPTAVGTWTLTFSSATAGTVTAPGASPLAFSLPAAAAAQFANPLVAQFGVQPDSGWGEGQYTDVAHIQTAGVASPGVAINTDFTTATSIDTNVWDVSNSAQISSLVLVDNNAAWWVYWSYPDYSSVLGTKGELSSAIPWKTPAYYTGYTSNSVFNARMGNNIWSLVPGAGLPTVDGLSNGVRSANAFFRVSYPGPTE
jgi:hypothetical protein